MINIGNDIRDKVEVELKHVSNQLQEIVDEMYGSDDAEDMDEKLLEELDTVEEEVDTNPNY